MKRWGRECVGRPSRGGGVLAGYILSAIFGMVHAPTDITAREAVSKTQFCKPGPGVLTPGGLLRASGTRLATTGAEAETGAAPHSIGRAKVCQIFPLPAKRFAKKYSFFFCSTYYR